MAPVVAIAVFVLAVTTYAQQHQPDVRRLDVLGYAWLLAAIAPVALRRYHPFTIALVSGVLTWGYYLSDYPGGPLLVGSLLALFNLAVLAGPLRAGIGAGVAWVLVSGVALLGGAHVDAWMGGSFVALTAVVGIGSAVRARRAAADASTERAAERAARLAEEERLRIAREVHDVVAHSLAMINVQAGVGAHVADRRPEEAKAALLAIKEASRVALADLRATLAVLRGSEVDEKTPAPTLDRRRELLDAVTSAGLRVDVQGEPGTLPAPVDSAAYRILQESLTNAVRHAAGATRVTVRFARTEDCLRLDVQDDGSGSVDPGSGQGLRGMRERAELLGGTVTAERDGAGFAVTAVLPISGVDE